MVTRTLAARADPLSLGLDQDRRDITEAVQHAGDADGAGGVIVDVPRNGQAGFDNQILSDFAKSR
jgi:hypothetical protein